MRKTHLFSLVAMLLVLCLALSACAGSSDSGSSSSAEPAQPNPNLESYPSSDIAGFKHEVGSCVFYTEHDLEDWIEGGRCRCGFRGYEIGKKYAGAFENLRIEMSFDNNSSL